MKELSIVSHSLFWVGSLSRSGLRLRVPSLGSLELAYCVRSETGVQRRIVTFLDRTPKPRLYFPSSEYLPVSDSLVLNRVRVIYNQKKKTVIFTIQLT